MTSSALLKPQLIFLGDFSETPVAQTFASFKAWEAQQGQDARALGFYVKCGAGTDGLDSIQGIRRSAWWNLPVFSAPESKDAEPYVDSLCSVEQAQEFAQGMLLRRQGLPDASEFVGLEERLLFFLYERGMQASLTPLLDRNSAQLYRYPVADLLAFEHEDGLQAVDALVRRGLLRDDGLVDRTRHCNSCHSAHIHFVDLCPHCEDIDIRKESALHCFACGYVGPESTFLEREQLECPKCHTHLRHIGVDYDKPLAQYSCRSCLRSFMEPLVKARCLDCGHSNMPSDLDVRKVCRWQLSAAGRNAIRLDGVLGSFAALKARSYVDPMVFQKMLDWAANIQLRHQEFRFNLMTVELHHSAEILEHLGAMRLYLMLDEFALRLNEKLRDSDVITRIEESCLLLLLPFTSPEGLKARIQQIFAQMASEDGDVRKLRLVIRTYEGEPSEKATALGMMQKMAKLYSAEAAAK